MSDVDYIIVGAGISGLTAALTILRHAPKCRVIILEHANAVGGLLRSDKFGGFSFDLGTHIPEETKYDELNELLYPENFKNNAHALNFLRVGNYFAERLNEQSQFPDISSQKQLGNKVRNELHALSNERWTGGNLEDYIKHHYGDSISTEVLAPLMTKFTEKNLSALSAEALKYYGLSRLICGNREQSITLKQQKHLDAVLAFANDSEMPRKSTWYYPDKQRGIGLWVDTLKSNIEALGGEFKFNSAIADIKTMAKNSAYNITLKSGEMLRAKKLLWTIPNYFGLAGVKQNRPLSRSMSIFHFTSDTPPLSKCHYIYCFDAKLKSYRVTIYHNLQVTDETVIYRCSIEVIHDFEKQPSASDIAAELKRMGLFSLQTRLELQGISAIAAGFPIPIYGNDAERQNTFKQVTKANPGVEFLGRAKPELFFMTDVLVDSFLASRKLVTQQVTPILETV